MLKPLVPMTVPELRYSHKKLSDPVGDRTLSVQVVEQAAKPTNSVVDPNRTRTESATAFLNTIANVRRVPLVVLNVTV